MPNTSAISEELAVTKNDIKHLESDMLEIKTGIKEINENVLAHMERMDEKYLRKEDFREHKEVVEKKFDRLKEINFLVLGCMATGLILLVVNLFTGHFK